MHAREELEQIILKQPDGYILIRNKILRRQSALRAPEMIHCSGTITIPFYKKYNGWAAWSIPLQAV